MRVVSNTRLSYHIRSYATSYYQMALEIMCSVTIKRCCYDHTMMGVNRYASLFLSSFTAQEILNDDFKPNSSQPASSCRCHHEEKTTDLAALPSFAIIVS